jgi:Ser-tRNA(Ala) deacylase AlaX
MADEAVAEVLACQRDAYLRALTTTVARCDACGEGRWALALAQSPMFPEGGGQPCDTGVLRPAQGGGAAVKVVEVRRQQVGAARRRLGAASSSPEPAPAPYLDHRPRRLQGAVLHVTDSPLPAGTEVEVELDWSRRYDLMQQHTGERGCAPGGRRRPCCSGCAGRPAPCWRRGCSRGGRRPPARPPLQASTC